MSGQDFVVVERKVGVASVLLVMLMLMVFISVAINFYYWQQVQELAATVKVLSGDVKRLSKTVSDLETRYRAVDMLVELQIRSIIMRSLRDMGFSQEEIEALLQTYLGNRTTTSGG
jgi:hypothetical protein